MASAEQVLLKLFDRVNYFSQVVQSASPKGMISARMYVPKKAEILPAIIYYHGGGWAIADINTYDSTLNSSLERRFLR